jgi:hypothetical protein
MNRAACETKIFAQLGGSSPTFMRGNPAYVIVYGAFLTRLTLEEIFSCQVCPRLFFTVEGSLSYLDISFNINLACI